VGVSKAFSMSLDYRVVTYTQFPIAPKIANFFRRGNPAEAASGEAVVGVMSVSRRALLPGDIVLTNPGDGNS